YSNGDIQDVGTAGIKILDTQSGDSCSNNRIQGSLAYLQAGDRYPGSLMFWDWSVDCVHIEDTIAIVHSSNANYEGIGGFRLDFGTKGVDHIARNITSVRSNNAQISAPDLPTPDAISDSWTGDGRAFGATIDDVPSPWTATATGANICYR